MTSKDHLIPRESEQTSVWSFVTRKLEKQTLWPSKADESEHVRWCSFPHRAEVAADQLVGRSGHRASAPSAYRQGNTGRQMGQGESPATRADPLVEWQSPCRQTSDGNPRQEHRRSGQRPLGHSRKEGTRRTNAQATRLPSSPAQAGVHSKKQPQTEASLDSVDEGEGHASPLLVGAHPYRRNHGRSQLVWVSAREVYSRCHRPVLQGAEP